MWILVIKIMSTKLVIKEWFTTQLYESAMDSTPRLTMINPLFSWPSWSAHYRALQPSNSHVTLIHCSTQHKENYVAWVQEPGGRVHKPALGSQTYGSGSGAGSQLANPNEPGSLLENPSYRRSKQGSSCWLGSSYPEFGFAMGSAWKGCSASKIGGTVIKPHSTFM